MTDHVIERGSAGSTIRSRLSALGYSVNVEGTLGIVALILLWQLASYHASPMFFPSLQRIWQTALDIFGTPDTFLTIATSAARILGALVASFALGATLGVAAAINRRVERFLLPLIELKQGVPAVCWIIFATLWFRQMEVRIAFVVIITALPVFFYQSRDAVRDIPADLWGMIRALRPNLRQLLRILVIPSMLPATLTAWRINIGNGIRVTIMAELLSGISGVGYQLRLSQELFHMDQVIVWTVVLILFVVLGNLALSAVERRALAWRPKNGAGHV